MTGRHLTDLTFDDWVEHVFAHAVPFHGQAWYFEPDCDWWDPTPEQAVAHFTRLCATPGQLTEQFSDGQIAQGFWYLLNNASMHALIDASVPLAGRTEAVRLMAQVFRNVFQPRCAPVLSHLDEAGANALNTICYMWWDILPLFAEPGGHRPNPIDDACLSVMRETLALANPACQESALHGLGHWAGAYPLFVAGAIDDFLTAQPNLRPELKAYALAARSGCVQ